MNIVRPSRFAEPWRTIDHGSDYASEDEAMLSSGKGYVGQVGAL